VYGNSSNNNLESLKYTPGAVDYINFISPFDDSRKFLMAVNKDAMIMDSLSGEVRRTLPHPKQVTQLYAFNNDKSVISCCRDTIVRIYNLENEGMPFRHQ